MKKDELSPANQPASEFKRDINTSLARRLTPFETRLKTQFEDLRNARITKGASYAYMVGFIYAPHSELKIRIGSNDRSIETQIFSTFSHNADYRLLFTLDLQDPRPFEDQWFGNQTFGRNENYNSAFDMHRAGERIHAPKIRELIHRHDRHTGPTLKMDH